MNEKLAPARLTPPGRILERELDARGWTQRDLAAIMERPAQAINEIIKGNKQITPDTAIELSKAFGTSAEFWTTLEANYRLGLARRQRGGDDDQIARRSHLFSLAPINELLKRGWIKSTESIDDLERELCHFFGVTSLNQVPALRGELRASSDRGPEYSSIVAWSRRVEYIAQQRPVTSFDRARLREALPDIRRLAETPAQVAKVPVLLEQLGVRLVLVRHLPKTFVDGVACEVDGLPVIGMSLRYDRIDSFWYTLMHELAHIALGHVCPPVDNLENSEQLSTGIEAEADQYARKWLIDERAFELFVKQNAPYFYRTRVEQFASSQHLHPGIVVGQLHHEKHIPYANLRTSLVKVSSFLREWMDPTFTNT